MSTGQKRNERRNQWRASGMKQKFHAFEQRDKFLSKVATDSKLPNYKPTAVLFTKHLIASLKENSDKIEVNHG